MEVPKSEMKHLSLQDLLRSQTLIGLDLATLASELVVTFRISRAVESYYQFHFLEIF